MNTKNVEFYTESAFNSSSLKKRGKRENKTEGTQCLISEKSPWFSHAYLWSGDVPTSVTKMPSHWALQRLPVLWSFSEYTRQQGFSYCQAVPKKNVKVKAAKDIKLWVKKALHLAWGGGGTRLTQRTSWKLIRHGHCLHQELHSKMWLFSLVLFQEVLRGKKKIIHNEFYHLECLQWQKFLSKLILGFKKKWTRYQN